MRRLAIILIIFLTTAACRTIRESVEMERPVVIHDTIMQMRQSTDSIYIKDSVYVAGDIIHKERIVYRSKLKTDTIYIVKTDTISIVKTKTISKTSGWLDSSSEYTCKLLVILVLIIFVFWFRRKIC